jgi:hypothetical protein
MKAIVADAYGLGFRTDVDGYLHPLAPDSWTEIDVRDTVTAVGSVVVVRYRDDGHEVEVEIGATYQPPAQNDDVIDARNSDVVIDELIEAMDGMGAKSHRILELLYTARHSDYTIEAVTQAFLARTGGSLEGALRDELNGDDLDLALRYLA